MIGFWGDEFKVLAHLQSVKEVEWDGSDQSATDLEARTDCILKH